MKKKAIILTMLVSLIILGCSKATPQEFYGKKEFAAADVQYSLARNSAYSMTTAQGLNEGYAMEESIRAEESIDTEAANIPNDERKLIKSAYVRIRVDNLDAADSSITILMSNYQAYSASTVIEENSRNYSIRVPAPQYDAFLAEMSGMGRVIRRSENTEDVTLRYYDLEGRLQMKRELLRTFQSYLTRARNIEEILSVETRIAELQNDIEGTAVQLRYLSNRIDYATIDLNLLGPVSASQSQGLTLGERIKGLFGNFGDFLSTVAIVIIGIIIFGIPLVIICALLYWLLFGKIGLLKKLWGLVKSKKEGD